MVAVVKPTHALIRAMQPCDLDAVHINECLAYDYPWTRGIFADCLRVGYPARVLEVGDDVIGHAIISIAAGEAHLLNICIQPAWQGHGYGRRLLHHCLHLATQGKANRLFLEVRPSNWPAIRMYQSEGFSVVGRRNNYYRSLSEDDSDDTDAREDALVMAKNLSGEPDQPAADLFE